MTATTSKPVFEPRLVHEQRLSGAMEAARRGVSITFDLDSADPAYLCWYEPGKRHVIAAGPRRCMLAAKVWVISEFERQRYGKSALCAVRSGMAPLDRDRPV